ncbi:hypothetical protein O0555_21810 [Brevibacillus laterosporus]|uniref:hypothetical protein n=1 Tax=Brevibacillus laterosporus TaxID=1465 RepID=UPI0018CE13CC|nr:hypothetical protein [Brevibacillus laterosporus]MBG9796903.1 hypothetical protein [Brevibacillus laterosporus]MCR8939942.1 hypothetical protein [Brevibacillus laterosporus]MCZ0842582.1 hypothetical protein [Brevibacillus laterosporus]MCZ0847139.1 hypothetical protein [Brevibacillus laterosporus]MED1911293.1 hypothetical protein [Brevibacillus laterosporus]
MFEPKVIKIKRITIGCLVDYCGLKYYEINHYYDTEDGQERRGISKFTFSFFKNKGITQRFNGTKKINNWLASEEGRREYISLLNEAEKYFKYI